MLCIANAECSPNSQGWWISCLPIVLFGESVTAELLVRDYGVAYSFLVDLALQIWVLGSPLAANEVPSIDNELGTA
jgi:hypothetical protein